MKTETANPAPPLPQQIDYTRWLIYLCLTCLCGYVFKDAIAYMIGKWNSMEEYSHGWLIPAVSGYLIWQKKELLSAIPSTGSWLGVSLALVGLLLFMLGELSALYTIEQYALIIVIFGIALGIEGSDRFRVIFVPLAVLVFMIPLPTFLYRTLSAELQLISSKLGVEIIRLCDIAVNLQGNVIDLGSYQLQVVEACNGLRYLFPLMSLAFICAYFFNGALWKRAIIFLSSIPITIFMNSFRIGMIGVLVEYFGIEMANGFLHDFEGWAIFMLCLAILLGEMWLFTKLLPSTEVNSQQESIQHTSNAIPGTNSGIGRSLLQSIIIAILIGGIGLASASINNREEIRPSRELFVNFPTTIDNWEGKRSTIEKKYRDILKFDDYFMADFSDNKHSPINYYLAYYASQRKGSSVHSPRSCIPGGGWRIESIRSESLIINKQTLKANRVLIQKGSVKQLVYYWFDQRGRKMTNEYLVKWFLFWDALTKNRTDGALVRFTTIVSDSEDLASAERRLQNFIGKATANIGAFIPE